MRATRALAVVLLAGCFVSGCGSGGPKIPDENLGRLVLHAADLPRSFAPFYNGPQAKIDGVIRAIVKIALSPSFQVIFFPSS